jgi:hypothetical protein
MVGRQPDHGLSGEVGGVIVQAKRRLLGILIAGLAALTIFALFGITSAPCYPPAASGGQYSGWTGEQNFGTNPRHVQTAYAGGYMYYVWDSGSDVAFRSSTDGGINFSGAVTLDVASGNTARDAYIDAYTYGGVNYVAASWKEYDAASSKWSLVVATSSNAGTSWTKYRDLSATCSNYEAHIKYDRDGSGNIHVHGVYVSDSSGQNEVYYRRFSAAGALEQDWTLVSDGADGVADSEPCLVVRPDRSIWTFYSHKTADSQIWLAYSSNGSAWGQELNMIAGQYDLGWPECTMYGSSRTGVVCQGFNGANYQYSYRTYTNAWQGQVPIGDTGPLAPYPQITRSAGSGWLVTIRDSGESRQRISGWQSPSGDNSSWTKIDNLFYNNISYENPGSHDCCTDGTRLYAVSASSTSATVLLKREDLSPPVASLTDPGRYHNANFMVSAVANDNADWPLGKTWFLSPDNQAYQAGIVKGTFGYKLTSSSTWTDLEDTNEDGSWAFTFPGASLGQGEYNLRFIVEDTSEKTALANYSSTIYVDRTPPNVATGSLTGGVKDTGATWYRTPPTITASFSDTLSGIDDTTREYRINNGAWQLYSAAFEASEGDNNYYFRAADLCGNMSSSTPTALSVKVDITKPDVSASLPAADGLNGWRKSNAAAAVTIVAADNAGGSGVASISYAWDGSPSLNYSAPIVAPEGVHTIYFQSKDLAGNYSEIKSLEIKKDTTAPQVEILAPASDQWIKGMVTVQTNPTDNLGVGAVDYYLGSDQFDHRTSSPWNGFLDTTAWSNDYYDLKVVAEDLAGNRSTTEATARVFVSNGLSETNYFAEGTTREGFDTWLCIQNPNEETAAVTINFQLGPGQGSVAPRSYDLAPHSRTTIPVRNEVGDDKDLSISVTSTKPLISERPMYFEYTGTGELVDMYGTRLAGNHTAQGTQLPSKEWFLAEGCTRTGFEEWICIQNPGDTEANVKVSYILGTGEVIEKNYVVDRWQRYTILVNQEIGYEQDVSVQITSDQDIVAERPMYFMYQGGWDGGHNVMGVPSPSLDWYFAEGCTRPGFNEWLCLMNPGEKDSKVQVKYVTEDVLSQVTKDYVVPAHSRYTINVNNDVARDHDVSCYLSCTNGVPIVAERAMYFTYGNVGPDGIDEGSCATGCTNPQSTFYLAEGTTRDGFIEYLCIQNPGDDAAEVSILYMFADGNTQEQKVQVAAHTRITVTANDFVGQGNDIAARVSSTQPIILERPMYSWYTNSGGSFGGADTLTGYTFDR